MGGAAFGAMLVEEFKAARPSLRALETTGPAIRRTLKFKPSIAEALGELKAQESKWSERELVDIGGTAFLLEEAIPKAEERLAQAEMEKAERKEQGRRLKGGASARRDCKRWRTQRLGGSAPGRRLQVRFRRECPAYRAAIGVRDRGRRRRRSASAPEEWRVADRGGEATAARQKRRKFRE